MFFERALKMKEEQVKSRKINQQYQIDYTASDKFSAKMLHQLGCILTRWGLSLQTRYGANRESALNLGASKQLRGYL